MGLNRQQLLERRNDLSPFLIHLTRSGDFKRAKDLYSLPKDDWGPIDARTGLASIIQNRRIEARSAFGYFNFKIKYTRPDGRVLNPNSQIKRDWLKAVCFTETPIDHVHLQTKEIYGRQLSFQPYGLTFRESVVRRANGNPIFYVQTTNQSVRFALDKMAESTNSADFKTIMPLYEGFGPPWFPRQDGPTEIDFRWEREWRIAGDFSFSLSDVAFGLCPASDKSFFETLVNREFPFVDPTADINLIKAELHTWPHLADLR